MKKYLIFICFTFVLPFLAAAQSESMDVSFVCPPCGCSEDHTHFEKPGSCEHCGMTRVATYKGLGEDNTNRQSQRQEPMKVAILVFNGVQIIDYTGPYEVFGQAGMKVFTVAETEDMITTAMGMKVIPHYSFENAPKADIVVFPGGGVNRHLNNTTLLEWVKKSTAEAETALSVCNGAYYLAEADLLDGLEATTFASLIPGLKERAPKATIVTDQRYVDNGKIVTSAGLSSGIDAALHVVSKYQGLGRTQEIATNLEYDWDPKGNYVRAALADQHLSSARNVLRQFETTTLIYEGDRNYWKNKFEVKTTLKREALKKLIEAQLAQVENWEKVEEKGETSNWKVPVDKASWTGKLKIEEEADKYLVSFMIKK